MLVNEEFINAVLPSVWYQLLSIVWGVKCISAHEHVIIIAIVVIDIHNIPSFWLSWHITGTAK